MDGVLEGVRVLDTSWGISGPMAAMLLADQGADVVKVERPGGDPFRSLSGWRVWNRDKRRIVLDLNADHDRAAFSRLSDRADVVIESCGRGTAARLGVDDESLRGRNPRLVHCSITGYGEGGRHADRPAYDALVAARTGQQWDLRGRVGGAVGLLSGTEGVLPGLEAPPGQLVGAPRPGPLFSGVPWPSLATGYLAALGVVAALRAREVTGQGQHVHTSLLQGVLLTTAASWQRVERPGAEGYESWVIDPRAPMGFFQASDGRWTHHWVPLPGFVLGASQGARLEVTEEVTDPKRAPSRIGTRAEEMVALHHYTPIMAEAVAKFPADDWTDFAAQVKVPVQTVRSPEEALADASLLADGCVVEVDDPEVGPIRCVGRTLSVDPAPLSPKPEPSEPPAPGRSLASPLEGVVVLDLGLAVAGPFGTQLLSDLGAEVIKVNNRTDRFWMANHIAMCCNRGKRSIILNLKDAQGLQILHRLVERADVVHHNMRAEAAERLGVDERSLRRLNPTLVYCHTRGFEHGPRDGLPGNDQTGAALAGTEWLDGGMDDGGRPLWSLASLGDTGNGLLSAIGVIEALYRRDRTGEGATVDTSILYAHLLNASMAWVGADGRRAADRPRLDAMQFGWGPRYRLYATADGWICVAAVTDEQAGALAAVTGVDGLDAGELEASFARRSAAEWFADLDAAGVPCEMSDHNFAFGVFDDPEMLERGWVTSYHHPKVGRMDTFGLLVDLSSTPGRVAGPPLVPGQDSRQILTELGLCDEEIDKLVTQGAVEEAQP